MALFQELQVPAITILALPLLDLRLHDRQITTQLKALAIAEPDVVIGLAFSKLYAFSLQARVQLFEGAVEEMRKEE